MAHTWKGMRRRAVPHSLTLTSGACRTGIDGCLFLDTCFGQAKEVCQAASRGDLMDS